MCAVLYRLREAVEEMRVDMNELSRKYNPLVTVETQDFDEVMIPYKNFWKEFNEVLDKYGLLKGDE